MAEFLRRGNPQDLENFITEFRKLFYAAQGSDLRIGQMLQNSCAGQWTDLFNTEDEVLVTRIRDCWIERVRREGAL